MKKGGLRRKIFLYFFILIVLIMMSVYLIVERTNREIILNEGKKRALSNALYLAALSKAPLLMYDYTKLEQNVDEVAKEPDVVYAMILNKEGKVVAHSSRMDLVGKVLKDPIGRKAAIAEKKIIQEYRSSESGDEIWDIAYPIFLDNKKWGTVRIGFSKETLKKEIAQNRKNLIILTLLAIIFSGLASTILADKITGPIKELTHVANMISKGDLNRRIDIKTRDEIEELSKTFNGMIVELKKNRERQKSLIRQLKKKNVQLMKEIKTRRKLEEEIIRIERLSALGEMASGVAHDFNNILGAILGRTELLMQKINDDRMVEELRIIEKAALDGAETVRRIQNFSRMKSDINNFLDINLNDIIGDSLIYVETKINEKLNKDGVQIKVERLFGNIPSVLGDASGLREVFTNILLNAIDAMPYGGVIRVKTYSLTDRVIAEISDTGIGMSDEVRKRVFEPFFTTKESSGNGLGLSICYGIVARHGGKINVESRLGMGTKFIVEIPLSYKKQNVRGNVIEKGEAEDINKNILVINSDETIKTLISDVLKQIGCFVEGVSSGLEGIKKFTSVNYDAVIVDLELEDSDGWDVVDSIREVSHNVPIIIITGWGAYVSDEDIKTHRINRVLSKPFKISDLKNIVMEVVGFEV